MKKISKILSALILIVGLIPIVNVVMVVPCTITVSNCPGKLLLLMILFLFFSFGYFFFLLKHIRSKNSEILTGIEFFTLILQLVCTIMVMLFSTLWLTVVFVAIPYFVYLILLLGILIYLGTKHYICLGFISWATSIIFWIELIYG